MIPTGTNYIKRKYDDEEKHNHLFQEIIIPVLQQVENNNLKTNIALATIAVCGASQFLPIQDEYTGSTNPLTTLRSYINNNIDKDNIQKNNTEMENTSIITIPTFDDTVPKIITNRLIHLCKIYNIDHTIFTKEAKKQNLTKEFISMIIIFASDKFTHSKNKIWGDLRPIKSINNVDIIIKENI